MKFINNIITITVFVFVSVFSVAPGFAQSAKLTVPDSLIAKRTLYLKSQDEAPSVTYEGQLYYNSNGKIFYYDGSQWKELASEAKITVGTKIVAAWNSQGSTSDLTNPSKPACNGNGGPCDNLKADYTCTGLNDDVKIETALDALGSTGSGGKPGGAVYLLEGTYNIYNSIDFGSTGVKDYAKALIGTGKATVLRAVKAMGSIINALIVDEILISQLMLDGGNSAKKGIVFNTVNNSRIDKVWVENVASGGSGIDIAASDRNRILNNYVLSIGINLMDSANNILSGNVIASLTESSNCGISLSLTSIKNIISNNQILGAGSLMDLGIVVDFSSSNIISSNNIQGYTYEGIRLGSSSQYNIVSSNIMTPNYSSILNTTGINIAASSNYNTISTNVLRDNYKGHILMDSSSNNSFLGNLLYEVGDSLSSGIKVTGDSDNNLFGSNKIYDSNNSGGYGIFNSSSLNEKNSFVGNLMDGSGYGDDCYATPNRIRDDGINSNYLQKEKINIEYRSISLNSGSDTVIRFGDNPISALALNPSSTYSLNSTLAIENGKAVGDILILIGYNATNKITIPNNANTRLNGAAGISGRRTLGQYDILKLIWDGDDWVEISFVDNYVWTAQ